MSRNLNIEEQLYAISQKAQFAMLLDILTPKPGNVHRYRDHPDTRIIHFAASITQLGHPLYKAAEWGFHQRSSENPPSKLGSLIKQAVMASKEPHEKNTLLGTVLLCVPLAAAAGFSISSAKITMTPLHQNLSRLLHNTTVEDAIDLVRALQIANPGGAQPKSQEWTSNSQALDFQSPHTINLIRNKKYNLMDLQTLAASYDAIAQEYTTDFAYTFNVLYPHLLKALNRHSSLEDAVLDSYLWTLSNRPDSLIQRKSGLQVANDIMARAQKIYQRIQKMPETRWNEYLQPFDDYLRSEGSKLNPGTTADLISSTLFIALLLENVKVIY
jgi:triphosphoribosyl-dephospho-CoA synthase